MAKGIWPSERNADCYTIKTFGNSHHISLHVDMNVISQPAHLSMATAAHASAAGRSSLKFLFLTVFFFVFFKFVAERLNKRIKSDRCPQPISTIQPNKPYHPKEERGEIRRRVILIQAWI